MIELLRLPERGLMRWWWLAWHKAIFRLVYCCLWPGRLEYGSKHRIGWKKSPVDCFGSTIQVQGRSLAHTRPQAAPAEVEGLATGLLGSG